MYNAQPGITMQLTARQDTVEWYTSHVEKFPLSAAPEPKRRFLPSKHEAKRVMKLVKAIREGRILPYKPPEEREKELEEEEEVHYDLWADETPRPTNIMHIPAPKLAPPGYDLSYNPPPEYLPTKVERKAWEETDPEEREKSYLPQKYESLRRTPAYDEEPAQHRSYVTTAETTPSRGTTSFPHSCVY
jgi:ribosome biogenesis protein ERB1